VERRAQGDRREIDATRRTRLANDRTYLAWVRSGLTALAVSLAAGKVVPDLGGGSSWPFELVGAGFGAVGVALVVFGLLRYRAVDAALRRGEYAALDERVTLAIAVATALLGAATVMLVLLAD
jgi:putative membrane protein